MFSGRSFATVSFIELIDNTIGFEHLSVMVS